MNNKAISLDSFEKNTKEENSILLVEMFGDLLTDKAMKKLARRFPIKR